MKYGITLIIAIMTTCLWTGLTEGADVEALDRVNVLMPRTKVVSILGVAQEASHLGGGLIAETYRVTDTGVMAGAGCVYDETHHLAATAFIFHGTVALEVARLMQEREFSLMEDKDGAIRLSGKDDDTGQPIVVVIIEDGGYTTVMTFEKGFYDKRTK